MISTPAVLQLGDKEIVPVRAIPFVTGGDMGPRCLARVLADPEQNFLAYVLGPNNVVTPMLPKNWRQCVAQLSPNGPGTPDLYTRTELEILPASTFVYWEGLWRNHEANFLPPREDIASYSQGEQSNFWLEPNANIPKGLIDLVFDGFTQIDHTYQPALDPLTGAITGATEAASRRQDRRLKQCEDAGLTMDKAALRRLPDGVGDVAKREGVSRQTFSADLRAAITRKLEKEKTGEKLHAT